MQLVIACCAASAAIFLVWHFSGQARATIAFEPAVAQLEKLGEVVTTKVRVADVLTAEQADYKGSWLIKGDALIAVDLTKAKLTEKRLAQRHAVILLPAPRVIQARVDHSRTKTWSVEKTTWVPGWVPWIGAKGDPDSLRDLAMAEAQVLIERAAQSPEALNQAREMATSLITNMYRLVDWEVEIRWQDTDVRDAQSAVK